MGEGGSSADRAPDGRTRREVLREGTALTFALFVASASSPLGNVAVAVGRKPAFLSESQLITLRAVVDRFIPGPPEDGSAGALAAGCAEAIDALLGAFESDPPRIYAGAPFSDRAGARRNHFRRFLRLDDYEEKGWRLRIKGSRGRKELEFNGEHNGWQGVYREGLAALDAISPGGSFADLPASQRDSILGGADDPAVTELIDVAFPHTWQFMYGAPEYGGNRDLIGWRYSRYDGDVQPRGWTREEIEQPGEGGVAGGLLDVVESVLGRNELLAIAPFAAADASHGVAMHGDSLSSLRAQLEPVLAWARKARDAG